jgi:DNA (cytosine-5)-methyltransferase 1
LRGRDTPPVDVLVGGFPCQDVSAGGRRAGITESTRSGLWKEYARLIGEIRPRYAVIENVKGLLSKGMEIVLSDLSALGYDADWTCLPAAALGAPHLRERVFIVAYPDRDGRSGEHRVLSPIAKYVGERIQLGSMSDWLGIWFERTTREAIRQAYRGCVLCRVDDGSSKGVDGADRSESGLPATVQNISLEERRAWIPRLKALGNGIVPDQAYIVARCILRAEGLL